MSTSDGEMNTSQEQSASSLSPGPEEWRNWRALTDIEKWAFEEGRRHGLSIAYRRLRVGYQYPPASITVNEIDWSYAMTLELMAKMEPHYLVRDPGHASKNYKT